MPAFANVLDLHTAIQRLDVMSVQVVVAGSQHAHSNMSVSDFISTTLPLLEMEKTAEIAQVPC